MLKSAGALFIESAKEVDAGNGSFERVSRSLAGHRFRQVAPVTDETFVSRLALRRLSTQVATDHFLGVIMAAANAVSTESMIGGVPAADFREKVETLLADLRRIVSEINTDKSVELSIEQLRGATHWDSDERYPSLSVFAWQQENVSALAGSGKDLPGLFERLLAQTDRPDRSVPKIWRRIWDNSLWWGDRLCSRTFAALLQVCTERNIQFRFRGQLTLVEVNGPVISRLNRNWKLLLCTESVSESAKHVARTLATPIVCLPVPVARSGPLKGFPPEVVELREQNAAVADALICFPTSHPAAVPLANEMLQRSDTIDVLAGLTNLIDPLPLEQPDENRLPLTRKSSREEYQLSLW
jgi:hypothetical protein